MGPRPARTIVCFLARSRLGRGGHPGFIRWGGAGPDQQLDVSPAALFQRYAQPEITLDDLMAQDQSDLVQTEWDRAASGLLLRDLQARATSLAKSLGAGQVASPERLSELRDLQAKIAELKQSLMQ